MLWTKHDDMLMNGLSVGRNDNYHWLIESCISHLQNLCIFNETLVSCGWIDGTVVYKKQFADWLHATEVESYFKLMLILYTL